MQASSPSDERIPPSSAPAPPPNRSPTARPTTLGISRAGREVRPAAQPLRSLRVCCRRLTRVTAEVRSASPRRCVAWSASSRAEAASRWARTWTSGATRFSTSCVTRCVTRRRSSTPPSCTFPVMASSHRVRTSPTPISSGGIPAGFVSGSSITPSARTPRSIPTLPTQFGRPPPDSRHSATMSSPACPLPCSTKPASRRGVPPSPPAPQHPWRRSPPRSAETSTTATSNPGPCSSPSGPRCSPRRP